MIIGGYILSVWLMKNKLNLTEYKTTLGASPRVVLF